MYSLVNELNLLEKHVGSNRIITRPSPLPPPSPPPSLLLAASGHDKTGADPTNGSPSPSPLVQVYPLGQFMELSPLIMANLDGVLPVLDVRIDGDSALVLRPTTFDDVHGFLKQNKRFSEAKASSYFRQMMNIVNTAHRHGIVLRDLKLKKFVFTDPSRSTIALSSLEDAIVLAKRVKQSPSEYSDDLFDSRYGCPAYVAPEMLQPGLYSGRAADMWSAGVILYTLLVGHYPFFDTNPQLLFRQIQSGYYSIPHTVSFLARSLICSLLSCDPSYRPSAAAVLEHPWLSNSSLVEDVPLFNVRQDLDQTVPNKKLL